MHPLRVHGREERESRRFTLLLALLALAPGVIAFRDPSWLAKKPADINVAAPMVEWPVAAAAGPVATRCTPILAAPLREWPTPALAKPATAGLFHHSQAQATANTAAAASAARPVSRALLQQLQQGCEHTLALTSRLVCRGARLCDTLVPGGGASPLPGASPTPPPAIIQTSTDGAAVELPGTDSAVAPGPPATPDDADGAAQQQAQQVVPSEADVPPADEGASPLLEPTEGPQPSAGPIDDKPQELPGNAVPLSVVAPPAPAITPAQPPAPVDGLLVPYCVCQQLCADVIAGRYGRHANTFCAADLDPQQPSTWFISVQGWGRAVCHNPPLNTLADSGGRPAELARTPFAKPGGRPPKACPQAEARTQA